MIQNIPISKVRIDGGTQLSARGIDDDHVDDLRLVLAAGADTVPIVVFYDGANYWLADGFHRRMAYRKSDREQIPADVRDGSQRDAVLYSLTEANRGHNARKLSREEKRARVAALLEDEEWGKWSSRQIAEMAGVHHTTVEVVRKAVSGYLATENRTYTTKHGTEAQQKVNKEPRERPEPPPPTSVPPLAPPPTVTDKVGRPVPHAMRPLFETGELQDVIEMVDRVARRVSGLDGLAVVHIGEKEIEQMARTIRSIGRDLKAGQPYALCIVCDGRGCQACNSQGFVTEAMHKRAKEAQG